MGMHRWLLGPLICLILATTSARPPECEEPPSWSINGQQPLAETKGKASMLEALLKHFRSYGMDDLEFIIINSKLSHSQDKLYELEKRVSFDVYQETEEEDVWSVMEGGKDDMFVYDRCGRLTYYIPFPLSILNESPLVSNAILATYFRSPCGDNCDQNKTLEIDEFVKNMEKDYDSSNTTEEDDVGYTETEQPMFSNETTDENSFSNDVIYVRMPDNNETDILNVNNTQNLTDYEYPTYDNSVSINETNTTKVEEAKSFFNSIYKLFFNGKNNDDENMNFDSNATETSFDDSNLRKMPHNDTRNEVTNLHVHQHGHHTHEAASHVQDKKKSNRCLEADYEVCKSWSKKRLLHAQRCCSEIPSDPRSQRSCHHFGKKRCKKLQSILKCCIKTVYTEPSVTVTTVQEPTTPTEEFATPITITSVEEQTAPVPVDDVVCCRTVSNGKECRVSTSGSCEEGEHVENSPNPRM